VIPLRSPPSRYTNFSKIQCASSFWQFEYSPYWKSPPGHPAHGLRHFLDTINKFQCHNLSANRKDLKPTKDLATKDQQDSLIYILDVYPGLYCSRVDVDKFLPVMVISRPILLVGFAASNVRGGDPALEPRASSEDGRQPRGSPAAKGSSMRDKFSGFIGNFVG
jgi:hypothetical protein